jgi:dolichol-phosphate mannosyltransferase
MLLAVVYLAMSFLTSPPPGITTVLMLLLINLGVMSLGVGVLGEYIAKIYAESKRRPLWLVDYTLNLDRAPSSRCGAPPAGVHDPAAQRPKAA